MTTMRRKSPLPRGNDSPQLGLDLGHELVVDLFAGGGGTSLGIEWALGRSVDVAVNHDENAVAMHRANHPSSQHFCESVFKVDPAKATSNRPVGLLWASPDCTHHSKAKGGKPVSSKRRGLAWVVVKWAKRTRPRVIGLENVEEFQDWGPVSRDGKPCKVRKGREFKKWVSQLQRLGYRVEHRLIRGCDFGSPTIRRRLFVMARCDGRPIVWPEASHADPADPRVVRGEMPAYRTAADCIDWHIPAPSIFERKRPLAENTMNRIAKGVQRFVIDAANPFIVTCNHGGDNFRGQSLDAPMRTITASHDAHGLVSPYIARIGQTGWHNDGLQYAINTPLTTVTTKAEHLLCTPFIAKLNHGYRWFRGQSLESPLQTITAGGLQYALASPFVVKHRHGAVGHPADEPLHTITAGGGPPGRPGTGGALGVSVPYFIPRHGERPPTWRCRHCDVIHDVEPTCGCSACGARDDLVANGGQSPRTRSVELPLPTVTATGNGASLAAAHMEQANTGVVGHSMHEPVSTIVGKGSTQRLCATHLINQKGADQRHSDMREPAPTICAGGTHAGLVAALLAPYYGSGSGETGRDLRQPAPTATTRDRFQLITVSINGETYVLVDIGMRMLQPRELFRAQGFPDSYIIDRTDSGQKLPKYVQVRLCGNSVCPQVAEALVAANFRHEQAYRPNVAA